MKIVRQHITFAFCTCILLYSWN